MKPLLLPCTLLVGLLCPGLSRAPHDNRQGAEGPSAPREASRGPGADASGALRHQAKRYLLPRTPPYREAGPDYKVVNCRASEGLCQEYCNYMEIQLGLCYNAKDACCLPQA
uniref:Uncharacterized protein n=1 Tax=Molossus molossus TaxID=27622 RepID=A0A7J8GK72_MOLMO|nr:hypothetical protein HJG59_011419 [Molossus molossus]